MTRLSRFNVGAKRRQILFSGKAKENNVEQKRDKLPSAAKRNKMKLEEKSDSVVSL